MDPSSAPSVVRSSTPSNNPSSEPTCYGGKGDGNLEYIGHGDCPLNECAGDCDENSDCIPGLICFQRSRIRTDTVPGCKGNSTNDVDYCIRVPTMVPTFLSSTMPSRIISAVPSASPSAKPSNNFSALPSRTTSAVPSASLSAKPSNNNSSVIPSSSPSDFCADSPFKFKIKIAKYDLQCNDMLEDDRRCEYADVRTHCPTTCGTCESGPCVDSKASFYFKKEIVTCENASRKRCYNNSGFFHTCRATCGTCPSSVPSTSSVPRTSSVPSTSLSMAPSVTSSIIPSVTPTERPSVTSSIIPSVTPTERPSVTPTIAPSVTPTERPSVTP